MTAAFSMLPIKRVASVTLGKMLQSAAAGPRDRLAPYLRAAHVQPGGRIVELDEQPMWFSPKELDALQLRAQDVVMVEGGAGYGRSAYLTTDLTGWGFQNSIIRVRRHPTRSVGAFINYALQAALDDGQIAIACNQATFAHFTAEKVAAFEIPVPPVSAQRDIADFLDRETAEIDAFIADQEELIGLLAERRAATISHAVTKGLDPSVPMKHSGVEWLGEVPEQWLIGRIASTVAMAKNGIWGAEPNGTNDIRCVRVADFDRASQRIHDRDVTMREIVPSERVGRVLCRGDLLLEKSGGGEKSPVGFVVMYDRDEPAVTSNFVARVVLRPGMEPRFWTYVHGANYGRRLTARSIKQSTGIQNLDQSSYFNEMAAIPELPEQVAIADFLDRETALLDASIADAREAIALSKERRAALISAAVTGKIDVRGKV